jgi:predicted RNA-binding Zn ribbon-like protein
VAIDDTDGLATSRLRLPAGRAPGGLCLVQELVNTAVRAPDPGPRLADLLAGTDSAARWLDRALRQWAAATGQAIPEISLAPADLPPLRAAREAVRALASAAPGAAPPGSAPALPAAGLTLPSAGLTLAVGPDGRVAYRPAASGGPAVTALVTAEILLAQQRGEWPRFKACPFPVCGVAFYDTSRNASRVWHDVRTCGNQANLRAYRARQAAAARPPG